MSARILVVDDEPGMRLGLKAVLQKEGYAVEVAKDGEQALGLLDGDPFDAVVTDLRMPKVDGFAVLDHARSLQPAPVVLMITAYGDIPTAVEAMKKGATDFIQKPFQIEEVRTRVGTALKKREAAIEEAAPASAAAEGEADPIFADFPEIISRDPKMAQVLRLVKKVAPQPCTVLINGETGTGKELIAQSLHRLSDRSKQAFVATATMTESLVESELFGHRKGAFTGAHADKDGYFKAADGGTLFLDEVADLPMKVQVKLLRVIQEGRFIPVGDTKEVSVAVRLVAATWKDLRTEIAERRFREDLYFRLNVITVQLPPLRDRPGDIPLLLDHFLKLERANMGAEPIEVEAAARERLMSHPWKGNIRELRHCCTRLSIFVDERVDEAAVEMALEG